MNVNYTPPSEAYDINNNSFFNPGCIDEVNKALGKCSDFKLEVAQVMNNRFIWSLCLMSALIFFQLYIKYNKPKFSRTEFWKNKVDYRLDLITIIFLFFNILYIFMM